MSTSPPNSSARSRMPRRPRPRPLSCGWWNPAGSKPVPSSLTSVTTAELPKSRATPTFRAPECLAALLTASCTILKTAVATAPLACCSSPDVENATLIPYGRRCSVAYERAAAASPRSSRALGRRSTIALRISRSASSSCERLRSIAWRAPCGPARSAPPLLRGDRLGEERAPETVEDVELAVLLFNLAGPFVDAAFELLCPAGALLEGGLQLDPHLVEPATQLPDLVVAGHHDRALQVAGGHPRGIAREAPDRPNDRVGMQPGGHRRDGEREDAVDEHRPLHLLWDCEGRVLGLLDDDAARMGAKGVVGDHVVGFVLDIVDRRSGFAASNDRAENADVRVGRIRILVVGLGNDVAGRIHDLGADRALARREHEELHVGMRRAQLAGEEPGPSVSGIEWGDDDRDQVVARVPAGRRDDSRVGALECRADGRVPACRPLGVLGRRRYDPQEAPFGVQAQDPVELAEQIVGIGHVPALVVRCSGNNERGRPLELPRCVLQELVDGFGADLGQSQPFVEGDVDTQLDRPDGEEAEERKEDNESGENPTRDPEPETQPTQSVHRLTPPIPSARRQGDPGSVCAFVRDMISRPRRLASGHLEVMGGPRQSGAARRARPRAFTTWPATS